MGIRIKMLICALAPSDDLDQRASVLQRPRLPASIRRPTSSFRTASAGPVTTQ
jgi:hypothetical protein